MNLRAPATLEFDGQRDGATLLERVDRGRTNVIGAAGLEAGWGEAVGDDGCVPPVRPLAMPTQQFAYWTPASAIGVLVELAKRWAPTPPMVRQAVQSRHNRG